MYVAYKDAVMLAKLFDSLLGKYAKLNLSAAEEGDMGYGLTLPVGDDLYTVVTEEDAVKQLDALLEDYIASDILGALHPCVWDYVDTKGWKQREAQHNVLQWVCASEKYCVTVDERHYVVYKMA